MSANNSPEKTVNEQTQESTENTGSLGARQRTLTEKGLEYQTSVYEQKFSKAISAWRRQSNTLYVEVSDSDDIDTIREQRDIFQKNFDNLFEIFEHLQSLKDDVKSEAAKFEAIEIDHQRIMQNVTQRIREIDSLKFEISSHVSSKTFRSAVSKGDSSARSSKKSNSIRISNVAAKRAALKTKLKYIDLESKCMADLQKVQTIKEMEMVGAELEVLEGTLDADLPEPKPQIPVAKLDPTDYVQSYVDNLEHPPSPIEVNVIVSDTQVTPSSSASQSGTNTTNTVDTHIKLENTAVHVSQISTSLSSTCSTSTSKLNPETPAFVSSYSLPVSSQTKLVHSSTPPIVNATHYVKHEPDRQQNGKNSTTQSSVTYTNPQFTNPFVTNPYVSGQNFVQSPSASEQGLLELAKTLADQVNLNRLPPPEPNVFYGDPIQYPAWKAAFRTLIDQRRIPAAERIYYLKRYLGGSVKQVVENYFLLSSDSAYDDAKRLLDERYGDPFVIASAFRTKLDNWAKINARDSKGLLTFSDFLKQCLTAMDTISGLSILNDSRENRKMLSKLPEWLAARWNRQVAQHKEKCAEFPAFKQFVEFVSKEAKIACDPVTSPQSLKEFSSSESEKRYKPSHNQDPRKMQGGRSFLSEVAENTGNVPSGPKYCCALCKGNHELDSCHAFLKKSISERKSFVKDQRLCFGCLSSGHIAKRCKNRKVCKLCSKQHPTSLHGDTNGHHNQRGMGKDKAQNLSPDTKNVQNAESGVAFLGGTGGASKCSMIVPVYVSHCDNPDREVLVYALLDTQSDTSFILENTCETLGQSGTEVKLSLSTMYAENRVIESHKVKGLVVRGFNSSLRISLPDTFTRSIMPANRCHIPTPEMAKMWPHLEAVSENLMPLSQCEIGLLIGYNCPQALLPREVIPPVGDGPFGQRTDLGWGIVGVTNPCQIENDTIGVSHRVIALEVPSYNSSVETPQSNHVLFSVKSSVKEVIGTDVLRVMEREFSDPLTNVKSYSQEDKRFLTLLDQGITFKEGHYEMPLPFKKDNPFMPNNKSAAIHRLQGLKTRFKKDGQFCRDYFEFMNNLITNGHAERVSDSEKSSIVGQTWYIPHHGVYHPQKSDKIRVVFDCSAVYNGECLNSHLLQGPDLTNKLLGVICRFRKESIAVMCDVEQMFYQFKVSKEHRDYLRFLWWDGDDYSGEPIEFRMTVHLFGATSSPGCANFGLKKIASDFETEYGKEVANFVRHDFYVDDGLKSLATVDEALKLIDKSKAMCSKGGVKLHKFASNSREVIQFLKPEERAKDLKDIDIISDKLPIERALGVSWCIQSDTFQFRVKLNDRPLTRRGILSAVSSLYDPLGFIAPVILAGKQILQQMCADHADWDDPLPDPLRERWQQWRASLDSLSSLRINRCVKPEGFGSVKSVQLHHFSDASTYGYGQCSYLRFVNQDGQVACSLIMGKARVVPLRPMTIPRLELTAALMSVKVSTFLDQELDYENITHTYWTDSKVVLGYIANETKRFHVYVANRVQQIREQTHVKQWSYVTSAENPADIASRGLCASELATNSTWLKGPEFLWKPDVSVAVPEGIEVEPDDPELKHGQCFSGSAKYVGASMFERLEYFSDWHRAKRAIALCLRFKKRLQQGSVKKLKVCPTRDFSRYQPVGVDEMQEAEFEIIRIVQADKFKSELSTLKSCKAFGVPSDRKEISDRHKSMKGRSDLRQLDPFIDSAGLIRVGGRIQNAMVPNAVKHPVVLPKGGHVTDLVVHYFHEKALHQGRGITVSEIRNSGYWVVNCSSKVANAISRCLTCRRLRSPVQEQKMASLPNDRLESSPPFTYCAVDCFGPFYIKEGRKELKRYGVLFTCMSCRAVHVETVNTMETDSFINCLRRFIAIRGPVRQLRCDRGSNFVGAENELSKALSELDEEKIRQFLLRDNCDLFAFKMNVPAASHMGGSWERQIRSIRNVLSSLLLKHGEQLNDESLRTFLYESAAVVNSRPLSVDSINDPLSLTPLTPNQLLTMKTKIILPPPGNFQKSSLYCRKHWRRTQYLMNEFWTRWRGEFLQNLQARSKWLSPKRNLAVGDLVLLKDDNQSRNLWQIARVTETYASEDGLVRKVKIALPVSDLDDAGKRKGDYTYLERPIHKLVLLQETEETPDEEP